MVTAHLETREKIVDAAIVVAAKSGFNRATTKQIAKSACVSEGIIYHYFKSKNDLYLEIIREHAEKLRLLISAEVDRHGSAQEKLLSLIEFHFNYFLREKNIFQVIFGRTWQSTEMMDYLFKVAINPYISFISGIISQGIKDGEFAEVDPDAAAANLEGMMQINMLMLHFGATSLPAQTLKGSVKSMFMHGLLRQR